jgi:hypothetical protein
MIDFTADVSELDRATAIGLDRGWDHANFVAAYGPEHARTAPAYPGWVEKAPVAVREAFAAAWELGGDRFNEGLYPDGSAV